MRKIIFIISIVTLTGCYSAGFEFKYEPTEIPQPRFSKIKSPTVFVEPFDENRQIVEGDPKIVYALRGNLLQGNVTFRSKKNPSQIIREGLVIELQRLGITVTEDNAKADGVIKGAIKKFEYIGYVGAKVYINLKLFKVNSNEPVWEGILNGFQESDIGVGGLNKALGLALAQLKQYPGFIDSVAALINTSPTFPQPVIQQPSVKQQVVLGGTGFLFSSKDYVITNHHLVRGRSSIKVTFLDGEVIDAKVVSVDKQNDIAFLKLSQSPKIPPSSLQIADSSTVKLGDKIFTIGYPASHLLGKSPKYSEGVINSIKGISDNPAYFQISVPIQPGNSGGPLFNVRGEVIGITTSSLDSDLAKDAMGAVPQNINYAVKSLLIKNLMPTIPDIMVASRGIVVVPTEPENNLSNFVDNVQNNIVLIEAKE